MSGKKGFTLLEMLIAIAITATGLVAVMALFSMVFSSAADSENTDIAVWLAGARLEEIRNLGYADSVNETDTDLTAVGFPGFFRTVPVPTEYNPLNTGLKQVDVTVYWQSKGVNVPVTLTTYISEN